MMKKQCGDSSRVVMGIESLLCEILSRLPVKPLMRFKCVCKQWQSLIQRDRSFIYLHFTRSKTSSKFSFGGGGGISLLTMCPTRDNVFSSVELIFSEGRLETIQREVIIPGASYLTLVFGSVNGLISLINRRTRSVCIFNPSTGQSTDWTQPPMFKQQQLKGTGYFNSYYYFGYDPTTMEHKVVCIWVKRISDSPGSSLRYQNICEVMKVDGRQHNNNNLTWRSIDDELSLPPKISPRELTSSLYANGSIYWLRTGLSSVTEPSIVEFNVGSEKFRVISIPNYIIEEIRYPGSQLIQIDGRLAVLSKKICVGLNSKSSMKMYVLYDKKTKDSNSSINASTSSSAAGSSVSSCGDFYWIQETFMMPRFKWDKMKFDSIQAVPGTDLVIIRSERDDGSAIYFYDWRKRSFSNNEQTFFAKTKHFVYRESLLPVRNMSD